MAAQEHKMLVGGGQGVTKWTESGSTGCLHHFRHKCRAIEETQALRCYCWISEKIPHVQNQKKAVKTCLTYYPVQPWILQIKELGSVICPWSQKILIKVALELKLNQRHSRKNKHNNNFLNSFSFVFTECRYLLNVYLVPGNVEIVNKNKKGVRPALSWR